MKRFPMPMSSSYAIEYRRRHHYRYRPTASSRPLLQQTLNVLLQNCSSPAMDWSAWLSKSSLHPSLAREYGLLFSSNELDEEDIKHLDHEFLLSMGVSVGKHRLEILKLARRERKGISSAVKKLAERVSGYVRMLSYSSSSAIVAVPKAAGGSRMRRMAAKKERLMITNGYPEVDGCSKKGGGGDAGVRWDAMFQDLKPT